MYYLCDESMNMHNPISFRPSSRIYEIQMLYSLQLAFDKLYSLRTISKWMRWEMPSKPMYGIVDCLWVIWILRIGGHSGASS